MLYAAKKILKKIVPRQVFSCYHWCLAIAGAFLYGFPSRQMHVIGITGTTGKSTTALMLARILEEAGLQVGMASTIFFKVGQQEKLNDKKMTMIGRLQLQKLLRQMARAKCDVAIVETTSEGVAQYRHAGINYDTVLFTNLSPEHIDSHGSFENYKAAKGKLFSHLSRRRKKKSLPKTSVINVDDEHAKYFLSFKTDRTYGFTTKDKNECELVSGQCRNVVAEDLKTKSGSLGGYSTSFKVGNIKFFLPLLGEHNVHNAIAATATALSAGVDLAHAQEALAKLNNIPGRLERIEEGQKFGVIVDYAFEPKALESLYSTVLGTKEKPQHIIHVAGQTGGGRDVARRATTGALVAKHADFFVVTDEDPYDEDPLEIMKAVAKGAIDGGMKKNENLFIEPDRREAIKKAFSLAKEGDLVLITGKGSEQAMVVRGKLYPWDDRQVAREELQKK